MAENWEVSVKSAAQKIADALQDAATLTVITDYVQAATSSSPQTTLLKLETVIKLDQDSINTVPVTQVQGVGLQVNAELHQIHTQNVRAASEYRIQMFNALLDAIKTQLR
ncbi:MAG: hypothetical protein HY741_26840 [Chloroflexi bacterium]|nr:hypothetical protein [Chloroflexota bacterium]